MRGKLAITGALALLLTLAGCTTPDATETSQPATHTAPSSTTAPSTAHAPAPAAAQPAAPSSTAGSGGPAPAPTAAARTVVRFSSSGTAVDVAITPDNPTARDFLSMLPLTLSVEEFAGREKIGNLPRALATAGSPGSHPQNGDLIYFVPWGNLGFYYNTDGIGYSDQTIHLGTYTATPDQLGRLEGGNVTVEIVK